MTARDSRNAISCQKLARILFMQGNQADAANVYAMARAWAGIRGDE